MASAGKVRIGISGWRYKGWRGGFYPEDLPQKKELEYASHCFKTIELNGSFYSLQRPRNFARWYETVPADFQFAVKGSRFITHMRRLKDVDQPLANFFVQGLLQLGEKLGPILWQFPPNFKLDVERMEKFFALLPSTHKEAAVLAKKHDARMKERSWTSVTKNRKMRHAIEIRNESFVTDDFIALLRRYNVALVKADTVEWPLLMDITSDFIYCRLHGSEELYSSGYTDRALDIWADRVARWSTGKEVSDGRNAGHKKARKRSKRDVYVYFDNDIKVRAPFDAQGLYKRLSRLLQSS